MKRFFPLLVGMILPLFAGAQEQCAMRLWYDQPAHFFEESLPIGNGKIGRCSMVGQIWIRST